MSFWHRALQVALVLGLQAFAFGQPAKAWTKTVARSGATNTAPNAVRIDQNGFVFVVKTRSFRDATAGTGYVELTKFTGAGAPVWTKHLVGQGSGLGSIYGMELDGAGNPVVAYVDNLSILTGSGPVVTKLNSATGAVVWETVTSLQTSSGGRTLALDLNGNVFLGGRTTVGLLSRMGVAKLNGATGALFWSKTVTRTANGVADTFSDLAIDAAGNVGVVGTARVDNPCTPNNPASIVFGKLRASDGVTLWTQTYTAAAADVNQAPRIRIDGSSNFVIAATAQRVAADAWVVIKRSGVAGAAQYAKVLLPAGLSLGSLDDLVLDNSNGPVVAGNVTANAGAAAYVVRLSNLGVQQWAKTLTNRFSTQSTESARLSHLTTVGPATILCAFSRSAGSTSTSLVTRLTVAAGATVWEKPYNGAGGSKTISVALAGAPNADAVVVSSVQTGSNLRPTFQPGVARMAAADGSFVFTSTSGNAVVGTPDFGSDIVTDGDGFSLATGGSVGRIVTVKLNSVGTQIWQNTYDDAATDSNSGAMDGGRLIARDIDGNAIVAGTNRGSTVVLKISGTTGGTLWSKRFVGVLGNQVAVNVTGDVTILLGAQVLRLSGATGDMLWTAFFRGTGDNDRALYVVVDGFGNAYVSGQTWDNAECPNPAAERIMVAKFDGTTGSQLWSRELSTPVDGHNEPVGIGLDNGGAVHVAGTSKSAGSLDFVTAKMFGTNGGLIWKTTHDEGGLANEAKAMQVDGAGNLVVTGTSGNNGWTIKAQNTNGALVWGSKLSLPTGRKVPTDIALDPANNVYVTGTVANGATLQAFGNKILTGAGSSAWTVLNSGYVAPSGRVAASVSQSARLHLIASAKASGLSFSNMIIVQFNP